MPKTNTKRLTQAEINGIKYISMADFSKRIDKIENIDDKLKFARQYLILHGTNGEPDCSIEEAINIARMKIADAAYELRLQADKTNHEEPEEEDEMEDEISIVSSKAPDADIEKKLYHVNPFASRKDDMDLELFMGHPVEYLRNYAFKKYNELSDENIDIPEEALLRENSMKFYNKVFNVDAGILNPQARSNLHVKNRLEAMFGGKAALEKAYRDTKPGFFSKMFSTSSIAATNLDKVYTAFNNPNHVLYGDLKSLSKAANEYLMHKLPNWKPGKPYPDQNALDKLDQTEKSRTVLCVAILKSVDMEYKNQEVYETIVKGCASDEELRNEIDHADAINQELFQKNLMKDLNDNLENNIIAPEIDNNNIIQKQASKDVDMDESRLDESISELQLKKDN